MNSDESKVDELTNETVREMLSAMEKKDVQRQLNVLRAFSSKYRDATSTRDLSDALCRVLSNTSDVNVMFRGVVYENKSVEASLLNVRLYAEAVNVSLRTMTNNASDPRRLIEEHVDNVIVTIKRIIKTVVFPALDLSRRGLLLTSQRDDKEKEKKLKKSDSNLAAFEKFGTEMLHISNEMMRRLTGLISVVRLQDRQLLEVSQIALSTLSVFGKKIASLQLVCLDSIQVIFYKYVKLREIIIQDILTSLPQLSIPGKNSCLYKIGSSCEIKMSSALLLRLAHVSSPGGLDHDDAGDEEPSSYLQAKKKKKKRKKKKKEVVERVVEPHSCAGPLFQSMLRFLITKCRIKDQFKMHARILEDFVKDVVKVLHYPEWYVLSLSHSLHLSYTNNTKNTQARIRTST